MKARIKETGKIVEICPDGLAGFLAPDDGCYYKDEELSTELDDWSSFRREAAKDILCAVINGRISEDVSFAIQYADELIRQLKDK